MLDKPPLEDEQIAACLETSYGLAVTGIEFLPLGYDMNAGVYRVQANGHPYFLKVKGSAVHELSVRLPRYLKAQGMGQIIAPLPTVTQELWGTVDHFSLLVYPFVEDTAGDWSDRQWIELGAALKRLHTMQLPPDLLALVPRETFIPHPSWLAHVRRLHAEIEGRVYDNPVEKQLADSWKAHTPDITRIVDQTVQSGRQLQGKSFEMGLCHADIHTGNVMIDPQGNLFIVDWDQPVLAPKERDLMFVTVGGFVTDPRLETLFFQGYGPTDIDPLIMAYYRYERALEDLVEFAKQVLWTDASDEAKEDAARWFEAQFAPPFLPAF